MKKMNFIAIFIAMFLIYGGFVFGQKTTPTPNRDLGKPTPTPVQKATPLPTNSPAPIPTNNNTNSNKTTVNTPTTKKRLAIIAFDNLARKDLEVNWDVGATMASLLAYQLANEKIYDLVDYTKEESLKELQDKSLGGRYNRDTALKIGKLKSANVAAVGQIIDFTIETTESKDWKGVITYTKTGIVTIIITLYDIQTGELIGSAKAKGTSPPQVSKSGIGAGIWGIGKDGKTVEVITSSNWQQTSMNDAADVAIKKIVQLLLNFNQTGEFGDKAIGFLNNQVEGVVADVDKKTKKVLLNISTMEGVKVGDIFKIMRQGDCKKDPNTGKILKCDEEQIAEIKITEATNEYSEGEVISGGNIKKRDKAVKKVE